ncbi:hypothetical protein Q9251_04340 [Alkalihalobacillus macyae]|uniref:hypothetical protein n=1 Tax=Guptibacillus hwajinpoensis TaxID=208199 RepID=UPI00273C2CB5|nr:hypothetical protein [Alkalihalobacillus macyae]MDP4550109.1 hypothetical protein [Alkalihalobacillus macyae]
MNSLAIIIVILISLWSITKTLGNITDKILDTQNKQIELLETIKSSLEEKEDVR